MSVESYTYRLGAVALPGEGKIFLIGFVSEVHEEITPIWERKPGEELLPNLHAVDALLAERDMKPLTYWSVLTHTDLGSTIWAADVEVMAR